MSRRYSFVVEGHLPPKKDGANSMWGKSSERVSLVQLRTAAYQALGAQGPLTNRIRLVLEIHSLKETSGRIGDLDNFIAGICDGLMAASPRTPIDDDWNHHEIKEIHPSRTIAIVDDSEVVLIEARKLVDASGEPWYRVELEGE